jgi:hypothetical protein
MVCYLILSHREPAQVARLVRVLVEGSPDCQVVVHHDQASSRLERAALPPDERVSLVAFRRGIGWGGWEIVDVLLRCLEWTRARLEFDWLVVISGQDYPALAPAKIDDFLARAPVDAYVHAGLVSPRPAIGWRPSTEGWTTRRYHYRYRTLPWVRASPRGKLGRAFRTGALRLTAIQPWLAVAPYPDDTVHLGVRRRRTPFDANRPCLKGSQWFTASRKAVDRLIAGGARDDALVDHYRGCVLPDESFVQTVLHNDSSLRVCNDDLRFTRWQPGSSHPDVLGVRDVDAVLASGMLFARKFDMGLEPSALDEIDRRLGLRSGATTPGRESSSSR